MSLAPLWTQYRAMLTPTPQGKARPILWRYTELRPHLLRTGELISTHEAERRVLMLMNPGLEGQAAATSTLFAGMQLILPGEIARAHPLTLSPARGGGRLRCVYRRGWRTLSTGAWGFDLDPLVVLARSRQ